MSFSQMLTVKFKQRPEPMRWMITFLTALRADHRRLIVNKAATVRGIRQYNNNKNNNSKPLFITTTTITSTPNCPSQKHCNAFMKERSARNRVPNALQLNWCFFFFFLSCSLYFFLFCVSSFDLSLLSLCTRSWVSTAQHENYNDNATLVCVCMCVCGCMCTWILLHTFFISSTSIQCFSHYIFMHLLLQFFTILFLLQQQQQQLQQLQQCAVLLV